MPHINIMKCFRNHVHHWKQLFIQAMSQVYLYMCLLHLSAVLPILPPCQKKVVPISAMLKWGVLQASIEFDRKHNSRRGNACKMTGY